MARTLSVMRTIFNHLCHLNAEKQLNMHIYFVSSKTIHHVQGQCFYTTYVYMSKSPLVMAPIRVSVNLMTSCLRPATWTQCWALSLIHGTHRHSSKNIQLCHIQNENTDRSWFLLVLNNTRCPYAELNFVKIRANFLFNVASNNNI